MKKKIKMILILVISICLLVLPQGMVYAIPEIDTVDPLDDCFRNDTRYY